MSTHQTEISLSLPAPKALDACRRGAVSLKWRVLDQQDQGLVCAEPPQGLGFTNPAQVDVVLIPAGSNTRVQLVGSNTGFGPIQSAHVRKQVEALSQAIRRAASKPRGPRKAKLVQSSRIVVNGVQLSDRVVNQLEQASGVRVQDGEYWYDRVCGAWGKQGGPAAGFVMPGLRLGGALRADASNGNTGVFINGRQLHMMDVLALRSIVPMVLPGRYWFDAQGNCGLENGPFLGNIWALAGSSGAKRQGILSTYDKTGIAVIG